MNRRTAVIIVTKNGEKTIGEVLMMVFKQKTKYLFEVVVIDSSSTDKTAEIVNTFSRVKFIQINPEEFGHGKTRKFGASLSQTEYIVFLNQDALPKDEFWLENLLRNFENNDNLAGIYSRHIPKDDCNLLAQIEICRTFTPMKMIKKYENLFENDFLLNTLDIIRFSTVSCAIKKEIFDKFPFNENLLLAEDQEWSKRVLEAGYEIVYEPSSIVVHSHNYTIKEFFLLHYKSTKTFNSILKVKKNINSIVFSIILYPFNISAEIINQTSLAKKKKYKFNRILREAFITFMLRSVAFLGTIKGNILSMKNYE